MPQTIFALSSGSPPAGIAVVRISGPRAGDALAALAGRMPAQRLASLSAIRDPGTGELLDRGLLLWFPGPASATGEDLAELHLHGGRSVVAGVLEALGRVPGLRPAEAGEFTRRAFANGRIDLAEAEGLADLLTAETRSQRQAALVLAGGALSRQVEQWRGQLLGLGAALEAMLDFADESDVADQGEQVPAEAIGALAAEIRALVDRPPAERLRDGVRIVIAGPPNAGKSTLFNAIAGREAAITSPTAGTTRDLIEAPVALSGLPLLLIDTAGLRDSGDAIEAVGVERAQQSLAAADLILWLGNPADCPDPGRAILVKSKSDLDPSASGAQIAISARTGAGMDDLLQTLIARAREILPGEGEVAVNARHRQALAAASEHLAQAAAGRDPILVSEELRQARAALDRVTGRAGVEDMLDALFGTFCIGK